MAATRGSPFWREWALLVMLVALPRCSCLSCNSRSSDESVGCSSGGGCSGDFTNHSTCPDVVPAGTHTINTVDGYGTCKLVCQTGWLDCDNNPNNGCETAGNKCPYDSGFALPELIQTLVGTPRGLAACGSDLYVFDDDELYVWDGTSSTPLFASSGVPAGGLACDAANLYWSTLSDPDGGPANGAVWTMSRLTNMPSALATGLDPGRGIDSRDARVYWLARSGFGDAGMLAYVTNDGGVVPEMTASETDAYKVFALGADGDYVLANGSIWFAPLDPDAGGPFALPHDAGTASSLLAVNGSPFVIAHGFGFYDAGSDAATDAADDANVDADTDADMDAADDADAGADDAGDGAASSDASVDVNQAPPLDSLIALDPPHVVASNLGKVVTSTAGTIALVATDDAVFLVDVTTKKVTTIASGQLHVADVAIDATYAYWTTLGKGTSPGAVWRAKLP